MYYVIRGERQQRRVGGALLPILPFIAVPKKAGIGVEIPGTMPTAISQHTFYEVPRRVCPVRLWRSFRLCHDASDITELATLEACWEATDPTRFGRGIDIPGIRQEKILRCLESLPSLEVIQTIVRALEKAHLSVDYGVIDKNKRVLPYYELL